MTKATPAEHVDHTRGAARRERIERNIYRRTSAAGAAVFEVGYRDSAGRQRWQTVSGGIMAARAVRDDLLGRKGKGEHVAPNPRLRFGAAADAWLAGQVSGLRPATQAIYTSALETHLRPRWGGRRLDAIAVDDVAALVRELRAAGKAEWTISGVTKVATRVFKYARRRMAWHGENPVALLEESERPKTGSTVRRRIYHGDELARTLAAAHGQYRVLFALAAVTGARLSEILGLTWGDVRLDDRDAAEVRFEHQVDRGGHRAALKTEESRRTVEIPRALALMLIKHKLAAGATAPDGFVFATRSGRALSQRNIARALRTTQTRATDRKGRSVFPPLHQFDGDGVRLPAAAGTVPSFHSFRHSAASEAMPLAIPQRKCRGNSDTRTASSPARFMSKRSRAPNAQPIAAPEWKPGTQKHSHKQQAHQSKGSSHDEVRPK